MSNLRAYAERELAIIGEDGPMRDHVLRMVDAFADEGHSGSSAAWAVGALSKLLAFEPLTPLTGDASEWVEVGTGVWQNARCGHVFKDETGAYDSEGRIFREPSGVCFMRRGSRVPVVFPYMPKREYVDVDAEGNPIATTPPDEIAPRGETRGDVVAEYLDRPDCISAMADEIARLRGEQGRVTVLDEWRVVTKDGEYRGNGLPMSRRTAEQIVAERDEYMTEDAPHRVVRVALVEEDAAMREGEG